MIYFMDNSHDATLRIGHSGSGPQRIAQHQRDGRRLLALIRGSYHDEQALHDSLASYRMSDRGRETYRADDRLYDYVTGLLARNYAAATYPEVCQLPQLPFSVWRFGADLSYSDPTGQISLIEGYQPPDRPSVVNELVQL